MVKSSYKYVHFWGSQKIYKDFQLHGGSVSPTFVLFKGRLYYVFILIISHDFSYLLIRFIIIIVLDLWWFDDFLTSDGVKVINI